jgi:hypothetical protein
MYREAIRKVVQISAELDLPRSRLEALNPPGLQCLIDHLTREQKALQVSLREANTKADEMERQLSREMSVQLLADIDEPVKSTFVYMDSRHDSNERGSCIRIDLERLGYHSHVLGHLDGCTKNSKDE